MKIRYITLLFIFLQTISSLASQENILKDDEIVKAVIGKAPYFQHTLDLYLQRLNVEVNPQPVVKEFSRILFHYYPHFDVNVYQSTILKKLYNIDIKPAECCPTANLEKQNVLLNGGIKVNNSNSDCWNVSFALSEKSKQIFAVWQDERRGVENPDIYGQFYDLNLNPLGSNFKVHTENGSAAQANPWASAKSDGGFVVVWEDHRGDNPVVYARTYKSGRTADGDEFQVSQLTGGQLKPYVASDDVGHFTIVWLQEELNDPDIYGRQFNNDKSAVAGAFRVNDDSQGAFQWFPVLASLATGETIIVWEDKRDNDSNIYLQRLRADGSKRAGNNRVDDAGSMTIQWRPAVITGGGEFIVAWEDHRTSPSSIYAQWYNSSLLKDGSNRRVDDQNEAGVKEYPAIDMTNKRESAFCWQDSRNGDIYEIYATTFDENRNPLNVIRASDNTQKNDQRNPQVYVYNNIITFFWIDKNSSQTWQNVYANQQPWEALPVELLSFDVKKIDKNVHCHWVTASETNNLGFSIERQVNLGEFLEIGFLNGFGTDVNQHDYHFVDTNVPSAALTYRLKQIDFDGSFVYSDHVSLLITSTKDFELYQNYPNPFNSGTSIEYSLPYESDVKLFIYDANGKKVKELVNAHLSQGHHNIVWEGYDDKGYILPSGIYFYHLQTQYEEQVKKLNLVK